jgi:cellulose synthase operon protein YhjQ
MTEINPLSDQNQTPEDVATLYSWANLHGAKYRDFSAARAQTRESARLRAEQAAHQAEKEQLPEKDKQDEKEQQSREEAERAAEEMRSAEAARQAELAAEQEVREQAAREQEWASQQTARQAEAQAAQRAAREAAEHAARIQAEEAARQAAKRLQEQAAQLAAQLAAERAAEQAAQQRAWQAPRSDRYPTQAPPPAALYYPQPPQSTAYARPEAYRPTPDQPRYAQPQEENFPARGPWTSPDVRTSPDARTTSDVREPAGRPAWLSNDRPEPPAPANQYSSIPPVPPSFPQAPPAYAPVPPAFAQAPEDTLQGSRDRLTSRWFALRGVFDSSSTPAEAVPAPATSRVPSMAVFSLAGGVGKTSLVATLGRALSARGERVLLVDTAAFGLLPFFFGATDQRPGLLRTFTPPGASSDAPIQMVTIDPEGLSGETSNQESLSAEILKFARGASRILVDLATASGATTRRIMRMAPLVLVPVIPDMNSVVSVSSIDAFFEHNSNPSGKPSLPFYVLNQFDASLPLHLDVREVLREQLGERLLPFALRRAPAMSEALAEGMTVMDYAPGSNLAEDFATLAGWMKSLSAPATTSYRGVRWSER